MLLCDFPGELIIIIGTYLTPRDLYSLMLVHRRFAVLRSCLHSRALQTPISRTALYWAIVSNDRELARLILEKGDRIVVVKPILKEKPNVAARGRYGGETQMNIIHRAPAPCDDAKLELIMSQGIEVFIQYRIFKRYRYVREFNGSLRPPCTPFIWAVKKPFYPLLRLALDKSGDLSRLSRRMSQDLPEALGHAIKVGDRKTVEILLQYGANPNGYKGYTPLLYLAASHGRMDMVRLLLEHKADIEAVCDGKTAYTAAEAGRHKQVAELLLECNIRANPSFTDQNGRPAIYLATMYENEALVKMILEKGRNFYIGFPDHRGNTALHIAALKGNMNIAKLLLDNGAAVDNISPKQTALHMAAQIGDETMVRLLLENGAKIDKKSACEERTALHLAVVNGCYDVIKLLLEKKADVNMQDRYGRSPLHLATKPLQGDVVKWLLESGANPSLKDSSGLTPAFPVDW